MDIIPFLLIKLAKIKKFHHNVLIIAWRNK